MNARHSPIGAPPVPVCAGSGMVTALARTRRPTDPVSMSRPPIVWHVDVPGAQIVTDANAWFSESLVGPPLTTMGRTFAPEAGVVAEAELPPVGLGDVVLSPHCGVDT